MRNPTVVLNLRLRRYSSPELLPLLLICLLISVTFSIQSVRSKSDTSNSTEEPVQCQFLTKHNFSSQIPPNPHPSFVVTMPDTLWSEAEHEAQNKKPFKDTPEPAMHRENHEILLNERTRAQKLGTAKKIVPQMPYDSSGARHEIIPGSMLVASQKLVDVYPFGGSKILIVKVNQTTGFQSLIINKLISWEAITPLEEGLDPLKDAPLSYGGFLVTRERPLVSLTRQSVSDEHPEVLPNIYFLDQLATANLRKNLKKHKRSVTDYWFFVGYSAWGWNQLLDEIADGSWDIINGTVQQFDWPMKRWHFGLLLGRRLTYTFRA